MLDRGIKVGLGTDCSGGYEMGLLSQMRAAVIGSKAIKFNQGERIADLERDMPRSADGGLFSNETHLPLSAIFHMATLGGASLVGLEGTVGNFTVGKEWDAILVDVRKGNGAPAVWFDEEDEPDEGWEEGAFERFVSPSARSFGPRPTHSFAPLCSSLRTGVRRGRSKHLDGVGQRARGSRHSARLDICRLARSS